jgi:hypothetical protein
MTWLKACVVLLALANAGYFLWARGVGAVEPAGAPAATVSVPSLRLVSEGSGAVRLSTPAATPAAGMSPGADTSSAAGTAPAATAGPSAADGGGDPAGAPGVSTTVPVPPAATAPAAGGAGAAPRETIPAPPAANAGLLTDVKRCITVGPFPDVSEAAHAAATLHGGGYSPRQRVAEGEVWVGVWVYLPVPATQAAADQMRDKLKAGGIDDALEMPGPNTKPVISLGLYGAQKRAESRVAQVQQLGLNPGIADRKRAGTVYWVDVDLKPTDGLLNPADLQGESGRSAKLEVKACPPSAQVH